jgi:hypothetical protein
MRIPFVSTILGYPWGGGDKRWTLCAKTCLDRGDAVFLGISPLTADHPLVSDLVERIDMFVCGDRIYAGESTFMPYAGFYKGEGQTLMGRLLDFDRSTFMPPIYRRVPKAERPE